MNTYKKKSSIGTKSIFIVIGCFSMGLLFFLLFSTIRNGLLADSIDDIFNDEDKDIYIGVTVPQDDPVLRTSILLATNIISVDMNRGGGIQQKKIHIVEADNACEESIARDTANLFIQNEVKFVIDYSCSLALWETLPLYNNEHVIVVSPTASMDILTQSNLYSNFFRVMSSDKKQGEVQSSFIQSVLHLSKVALFYTNDRQGKESSSNLQKELLSNDENTVVYSFPINTKKSDILRNIEILLSNDVEIVVFGGDYAVGVDFIRQLQASGYTGHIMVGSNFKSKYFLFDETIFTEGVYVTSSQFFEENDTSMKKINDLIANFSEIAQRKNYDFDTFLKTYITLQIIVEALDSTSMEYQDMIDFMHSGENFETSLGVISFDEYGDRMRNDTYIYQIQNKHFIPVSEPP